MQFCALDDAHDFLVEAKGLPAISSASGRLRLCLRACILLSWVGLEDALDHATEHWRTRGPTIKALPTRLKVRMLAFLLPLSEPLLVDAEFDRLRKMRNQLAHPRPNDSAAQLTLKEAEQTFQFCLRFVRALNTYRMADRAGDAQSRSFNRAASRDIPKALPAKERRLTVAAPGIGKSAAQ
jgi:hypothetical protein